MCVCANKIACNSVKKAIRKEYEEKMSSDCTPRTLNSIFVQLNVIGEKRKLNESQQQEHVNISNDFCPYTTMKNKMCRIAIK